MSVDQHIQTKLKQLRLSHGYTLEQLAQKLETTPITLSRYETGKRAVSLSVLADICAIYQISLTTFFATAKQITAITPPEVKTQQPAHEPSHIKVYGEIAAGYFNTATEESLDEIEVPLPLVQRFGHANLFGLVVNGESMNKIVQNNDYVVLNRQETAHNGDIVAVLLNDEDATLKRFFQLDNETVVLKPESNHAAFQPLTIDLRQPDLTLRILGKVIWYCAPYYNNL